MPRILITLLSALAAVAGCQTSGDLGQAYVPASASAGALRQGPSWPDWQQIKPAHVKYGFDNRSEFAWDPSGLYGRLGGMSGDDVEVQVELLDQQTAQPRGTVTVTYQISLTSGWENAPVSGPNPEGRVALPGQQGSFLVTIDRPGHRRRVLQPEYFATRTRGDREQEQERFEAGVGHSGEFWLAWEALGIRPRRGPYGWQLRVQVYPADRPDAGGTLTLSGKAMQQAMDPQQ
ncbi:MAG: hypothetical protein ACOC93_06155 [Planctomycetota bacterium]